MSKAPLDMSISPWTGVRYEDGFYLQNTAGGLAVSSMSKEPP